MSINGNIGNDHKGPTDVLKANLEQILSLLESRPPSSESTPSSYYSMSHSEMREKTLQTKLKELEAELARCKESKAALEKKLLPRQANSGPQTTPQKKKVIIPNKKLARGPNTAIRFEHEISSIDDEGYDSDHDDEEKLHQQLTAHVFNRVRQPMSPVYFERTPAPPEQRPAKAKPALRLLQANAQGVEYELFKNSEIKYHIASRNLCRLVWGAPPKAALIVKKPRDPNVTKWTVRVAEFLHGQGLTVFVEPKVLREEGMPDFLQTWKSPSQEATLNRDIDFAVTIGGEGTVLWCSRLFPRAMPPVISFAMGSLGFLTAFPIEEYEESLTKVIAGGFYITLRSRLCARVSRTDSSPSSSSASSSSSSASLSSCSSSQSPRPTSPSSLRSSASSRPTSPSSSISDPRSPQTRDTKHFGPWRCLNEVVIDRGPEGGMVNLDCYVDNVFFTKAQSDGIIIATPTGSSAYNLSAGGSLLHPHVPGMMLTPIAPHSLSFRPMLLPDSSVVTIKVSDASRCKPVVIVDGLTVFNLEPNDKVNLRVDAFPIPGICNFDQTWDWVRGVREFVLVKARASGTHGGEESYPSREEGSGEVHAALEEILHLLGQQRTKRGSQNGLNSKDVAIKYASPSSYHSAVGAEVKLRRKLADLEIELDHCQLDISRLEHNLKALSAPRVQNTGQDKLEFSRQNNDDSSVIRDFQQDFEQRNLVDSDLVTLDTGDASRAAPRPVLKVSKFNQDQRKPALRLLQANAQGMEYELVKNSEIKYNIASRNLCRLIWGAPPKAALIVKKPRDKTATTWTAKVANFLHKQGLSVYVEPTVQREEGMPNFLKTWNPSEESSLNRTVDFIVSLGGDGTVLWCSRLFKRAMPPVIAFALGSLGFLTGFPIEGYKESLTKVLAGDFYITLRSRLSVRVTRKVEPLETSQSSSVAASSLSPPPVKLPARDSTVSGPWSVLNEVVIDRGTEAGMVTLDCYVDNVFFTKAQSDGIIIATPTGSSAYNLSAGGTLVHPHVPGILITPNAPFSLSFRPLVVPDSSVVTIKVSDNARTRPVCIVDGQKVHMLDKKDRVHIRVASYPIPGICNFDQTTDWIHGVSGILHWNLREAQKKLG